MKVTIWQVQRHLRALSPDGVIDPTLGTFGVQAEAEKVAKKRDDLEYARYCRHLPKGAKVPREHWEGLDMSIRYRAVPTVADVPAFVIGEEPNPWDEQFQAPGRSHPVAVRIDLGVFGTETEAQEACAQENRASYEVYAAWATAENQRRTAEHEKAMTKATLLGEPEPAPLQLWRVDPYETWLASADTIALKVYPA